MAEGAAPSKATAQRDRYIDTLRAAALLRVLLYHTFGWVWLPFLFPSMGIMFALAGALVARSLERPGANAGEVIFRRLKRLLLPLWVFAFFAIIFMVWFGWSADTENGSQYLSGENVLFWVVPVADPPASDWGMQVVGPLWYLRTYLWLVMLSPLLLWCVRKVPLLSLGIPMGLCAAVSTDYIPLEGAAGQVFTDLVTFLPCWILGFLHNDRTLRRLPLPLVFAVSACLMAMGTAWAAYHPDPAEGVSITDIPFAQMLYCTGTVLLLLRFQPGMEWMSENGRAQRVISFVNSRAVTIYIWGNVSVVAAQAILEGAFVSRLYDFPFTQRLMIEAGGALKLTLVLCILGLITVVVGPVEDLAAGRGLRFSAGRERARVRGSPTGGPELQIPA